MGLQRKMVKVDFFEKSALAQISTLLCNKAVTFSLNLKIEADGTPGKATIGNLNIVSLILSSTRSSADQRLRRAPTLKSLPRLRHQHSQVGCDKLWIRTSGTLPNGVPRQRTATEAEHISQDDDAVRKEISVTVAIHVQKGLHIKHAILDKISRGSLCAWPQCRMRQCGVVQTRQDTLHKQPISMR